jgi:hypothetical protein
MPSWLGKVHPRYATPYAALIVQGIVSAVLVILNFAGAGVQETFQKLLSLAVVLQLVPFLYMFGALIRFAVRETTPQGQYSRATIVSSGHQRLAYNHSRHRAGIFPAQQITSICGPMNYGCSAAHCFSSVSPHSFFFVYGRHKVPQEDWEGHDFSRAAAAQ